LKTQFDAFQAANRNRRRHIKLICLTGRETKTIKKSNMMCSPQLKSVLSQEIRTQMNSIVGLSFLMDESHSDDKSSNRYSDQVLKICNQLIRLFENFLDSEVTEKYSSRLNLQKCELSKTAEKVFSEFRETLRQDYKGTIGLITENNCSDKCEVYMDKEKVSKILHSLFQNAVNSKTIGNVKVGCYHNEKDVTFFVLDSWQDYFLCKEYLHMDENDSLPSKFYDTGALINFTLAKRNIQLMGGSIWIEPYNTTGTGVYFSLPVEPVTGQNINSKWNSCKIKY
jgi:light-regulated signal transduction histidine kinase (bacteriophytochrome)